MKLSRESRAAGIDHIDINSDSDYEEQPQKKPNKAKKRKREHTPADSSWRHPVSQHIIKDPVALRTALLEWYGQVHETRGMPWRKPYNPKLTSKERSQRAYEVWVSEIMLQQTQVATVIAYYNRWMERFPTIRDLAAADIEAVNALWKGLGYYSRAARLLSGAQKIVREYDGVFPRDAKEMQANIPGIGRYSSGAIASIAYNDCNPVLDGNVTRLLCRLLALHTSPKSKEALEILWAGAEAMIAKSDRPGDINQGLIELGSTVCKVRNPSCGTCPLQSYCIAYGETTVSSVPHDDNCTDIEELCQLCEPSNEPVDVTRYPMKVEKKKAREELDVVCVIEWRSREDERWFLLKRRPETGLLAGLYEFPTRSNLSTSPSDPLSLRAVAHELLGQLLAHPPESTIQIAKEKEDSGAIVKKIELAGDVLHVFSHIRKTYRVQWVLLEGGTDLPKLVQEGGESVVKGDKLPEAKKRRMGKPKVDAAKSTQQNAKVPVGKPLGWVTYEDVEKANIGTGVLKVWKLATKLWENKGS